MMDWETVRTICWAGAAGLSLAMFVVAELEVRRVRRKLKESQDDLGFSRKQQAVAQKEYADVVIRSLGRDKEVHEGLSKEISLALDTLIACNALAEREKSILLAIAYHVAPLEQDGRLLSDRILSQLAFEDAIKS